MPTDEIVMLALGDVKHCMQSYLNKRKNVEILNLEARYMRKRDKGAGLEAIVRTRGKQYKS